MRYSNGRSRFVHRMLVYILHVCISEGYARVRVLGLISEKQLCPFAWINGNRRRSRHGQISLVAVVAVICGSHVRHRVPWSLWATQPVSTIGTIILLTRVSVRPCALYDQTKIERLFNCFWHPARSLVGEKCCHVCW